MSELYCIVIETGIVFDLGQPFINIQVYNQISFHIVKKPFNKCVLKGIRLVDSFW